MNRLKKSKNQHKPNYRLTLVALVTFYSLIGHTTPTLSVNTLSSVAATNRNQCASILSQTTSLGIATVAHGNTVATQGRHRGIRYSSNYMVGGFSLGTFNYTHKDVYTGVYKWMRDAVTIRPDASRPPEYDLIVSNLLDEWNTQTHEPAKTARYKQMETENDWRRSSFVTLSIEGEHFGGARMFDGNKNFRTLNEDGRPRSRVSLGDNPSGSILLPLERKFPGLRLDDGKFEIGLLTARTEVNKSRALIFYKFSEMIVERYGAGELTLKQTNTPVWEPSDEPNVRQVDLGFSRMQVSRHNPQVDYSEKVSHYEFTPNVEESLKALSDMYIYFTINQRMTAFYERTLKGAEIMGNLTGDAENPLNLARIRVSDFVLQHYFNVGEMETTLNQNAIELAAYKNADIRERRQIVEQQRQRRLEREHIARVVEETYPGASPDEFDVRLKVFPDGTIIETQITPKRFTKRYNDLFDDSLTQDFDYWSDFNDD